MKMTPEQVLINALDLLTKQVADLAARVDKLDKENEQLRKENRNLANMLAVKKIPTLNEPVIPITPLPYPQQPSWTTYGNCPKCGLKLDQVMGYVCPNAGCPTGLGGVWCTTNTDPSGPGR